MKKYSLAVVFFIFAICTTMAQQEKKMLKPKVMVVPEEAFCINSGMFTKTNIFSRDQSVH